MNFIHPDGSGLASWLFWDNYAIEGSMDFVGHATVWNNGCIIKNRLAFDTATGLNTLQDEEEWGANVNNRLYWFLYRTEHLGAHDMDYRCVVIGRPAYALRSPICRAWGLHILNFAAKNPHYQWYINHILYPEGPVVALKNDSARLIELALWWDPKLQERKPDDIPQSRFTPPGVYQNAIFRSGFNGKGDALAWFSLSDGWDGDSNWGAAFGSFRIYKDELLAAPTKYGPFWSCTYGDNNLAFFDTSLRKSKTKKDLTPKQAGTYRGPFAIPEGCDFPLHPKFFGEGDCLGWFAHHPKNICGTVTAFETRELYDYVAFKNESSFYSSDVVKEWTGQVVFLRPGVLVRFDRAEVADKKYQPRFFLWMKGEKPKINGKVVNSIIQGYVDDYEADEVSFRGHLRLSKLHFKALLPIKKHLRVAHGTLIDAPSETLLQGTKQTVAGPCSNGGYSDLHNSGGRLILRMKHKTDQGEQDIESLRIDTAPQPTGGNFTAKVQKDFLQLTQTAAQKDKKFKFSAYSTLKELIEILKAESWHPALLANYEHWVEGNIIWRSDLEKEQIPPFYNGNGELSEKDREDILKGDPGNRADILNAHASGHLEVRLPTDNEAPRQYFLNVITATDAAEKNPAIPQSALEEDEKIATAVLKWDDETIRISFAKTGSLIGHIKIEKSGKIIADKDFIDKIDLSNQPFGSDFIKGKRN